MSALQSDDVILEAASSLSVSGEEDFEETGDSENDIRELKARRHALANKLAQQQKRRDKIQVKQADSFNPVRFSSNGCFANSNIITQTLCLVGENLSKMMLNLVKLTLCKHLMYV